MGSIKTLNLFTGNDSGEERSIMMQDKFLNVKGFKSVYHSFDCCNQHEKMSS